MFSKLLPFVVALSLVGCGSNDTTIIHNKETNTTTQSSLTTPSKLPMLVVLVSYNNIKINYSEKQWSDRLFGTWNHQLNNYYKEVSASRFMFKPAKESYGTMNDGIISITLNYEHPDIEIDDPHFYSKVYPEFREILEKLDKFVDFSDYDKDKNGALSNKELIITFIIAGFEDAYEGYHVTNGIWAHQSCMVNADEIPILDTTKLLSCEYDGTFALFGEQHDVKDAHQATIGIIAHELAHATFNIPDLYNTLTPDIGGIGLFGIMGAGTWTKSNIEEYAGETPTHFSAWSKIYNGWITPQEIHYTKATLYESSSINYNIIKIPINTTSYYLLENRNKSGYDKGLRGLDGVFDGGVAIWKIDETQLNTQKILENSVNTDNNHKGVDIVEAQSSGIDSGISQGDEDALYYEGNKNYFLDLVNNISQRGEKMQLNILK